VFGALRTELTDLVTAIVDSGRSPDPSILEKSYPLAQQAAFGQSVAATVGFDFEGGRLDETTHPFCSGVGPGDTRITTRYDPHRFQQAFFATLHEAGHGIYAQGLDPVYYGTPMGESVSSGIHESQARTWENLVGRSRAFWRHLYPKAQAAFPKALAGVTLDDFYFAINRVQPSYIRVEADEVTYNLHIVLRFEIEQALLSGDISTTEVPDVWNEMFVRYLGLTPPDDARGCLQDMHWGIGYLGYFASYALGNLYAAQIFEQARTDLGDLDAQFAAGDFDSLRGWLSEQIYRQGNRYRPRELVEAITGKPPSHQPLLSYLRAKYKPLYGI
jgi:carboxypeptidase Taq